MGKTVYYFSASGNSLQAALDIGSELGADVVSISVDINAIKNNFLMRLTPC